MKIQLNDGRDIDVDAQVIPLESGERWERSLKKSALVFILALFSILIPLLHFVLVPSFLILTIVFFKKTFNEKTKIVFEHFNCPYCHKPIPDLIYYISDDGLRVNCFECRKSFRI